jgi:hypothetical protein
MSENMMQHDSSKDEISLKELVKKCQRWIRYLVSKWYLLLLSTILGAVGGYIYTKFSKKTFTASTTFVLESGENSSGGLSQYAGLASMVGIDLGNSGGGIFQGDNIIELYKSRKMIESTLLIPSVKDSNVLLVDLYLNVNSTKDLWKEKKPELLNINFKRDKQLTEELQRSRDSVINSIVTDINKNYLLVSKLDKKLSIIKVDVISPDEVFAKEFNNSIVKEVNDFYIQTKTKKSIDNIAILQDKTDSVKSVLNGAISAAAAIIDATPNLNPTRQAQRLIPTQRSQFSAETNKAILSQLVQNLELAKMALMKETPLIQVVDEPVYPLLQKQTSKFTGLIIGSVLMFFAAVFFLIIKKSIQIIMQD